jgi:outer membrane protein assembly factor BamB
VANGIVYVSIGGPNQLIALQPEGETITTLWTYNFGVTLDVPTAPAVANGIVYVGSGFDGDLFALDPATGDTLWSGVTQGLDNLSSPAVSNGVVFFGGDRRLFALALNGGNNAVYKRKHTRPPSFESLHPDFNLKPSR